MVEKNAWEKLNKTAKRNPVLSTVNGANGEPVALHVVQEIRTGSLSNKLNTAEKIVGEVQSKDAIWNIVPSIVNGANGEPAAQTVAVESKKELLKSKPSMVGKNAQVNHKETALKDHVVEQFLWQVQVTFN